ncbi:DUF317 domain-containing protein [Streptacidiphilus fuscans]|uniref:DUF317 domain-containing protein n=1 Tax=Streptacidiphilus fuscans TaxID=2789292 RepID=A0A931B5V2_9ACTN|nr:DUF317 domain-containing protein [Streptacidiphilus fuscans]MBF9071785.1 DUF317 domain-containing protein [Streptacidiphilus fuscans]
MSSPSSPSDPVAAAPIYLAGPGQVPVLSAALHVHGWELEDLRPKRAWVIAHSPCRRVEAAFQGGRVTDCWRITVRPKPGAPAAWEARFADTTPGEIVAALVQVLAVDLHQGRQVCGGEETASTTTTWRPLLAAGWQPHEQHGRTRLTSPDTTAYLAAGPAGTPTTVGAGVDVTDTWLADLSADTPVRYLHYLARALADPRPVLRDRTELPAAHLLHLRLRPAATLPGHHPAFDYLAALLNPDYRPPHRPHPHR